MRGGVGGAWNRVAALMLALASPHVPRAPQPRQPIPQMGESKKISKLRDGPYAHPMPRRNLARLIALTTVAAVGFVACGNSEEEASSEAVDRQAFYQVRGTEVCISREANAGPMTVTFQNNVSSRGNGPFNLDYVQCGVNSLVLRLDVTDAEGQNVLYIGAGNPEIGYPQMTVKSLLDNQSKAHSFSDGESYTYTVGSYSVRVERQPDAEETKSFRVWVGRS